MIAYPERQLQSIARYTTTPRTPGPATRSISNRASRVPSCAESRKCLTVTPLSAPLTHSLSHKSFPCHSYANTRDRIWVPRYSLNSFCRVPRQICSPFVFIILRIPLRATPLFLHPYKSPGGWGYNQPNSPWRLQRCVALHLAAISVRAISQTSRSACVLRRRASILAHHIAGENSCC